MKANRKILDAKDDDAVSPVIAVILMVAITVVLAATVYVWVSGFSGDSAQARTIALSSAGPLDDDCNDDATATDYCKRYTVASASSGLKWDELDLKVDGTEYTYVTSCTPTVNQWSACAGKTSGTRAATALVSAGDVLIIGGGSTLSGSEATILDADANSVIRTLTIS